MTGEAILVVEDDDNDLLLIRRSLTNSRISNPIMEARDGVEALDILLYGPLPLADLPAVVLLDVKLPRIDGIEVLRQLRGHTRTSILPVVMLTSSDEQEDLLRSYECGANSYVRKPIEFMQFQSLIGQLGLYWALINRKPRRS